MSRVIRTRKRGKKPKKKSQAFLVGLFLPRGGGGRYAAASYTLIRIPSTRYSDE